MVICHEHVIAAVTSQPAGIRSATRQMYGSWNLEVSENVHVRRLTLIEPSPSLSILISEFCIVQDRRPVK